MIDAVGDEASRDDEKDPAQRHGIEEPLGARRPIDGARPPNGYRRLLYATAVSNLADGIGTVAYPWLASLMTRSAILVAGVSFAFRLPWLLVSLPVGVLVDRADRRWLLVSSDVARAALTLLIGLMVVADRASLGLLYAIVVLLGVAEVVKDNSAQTILPRLVNPDRLEGANSSLWLAEGTANTVIGPWFGGVLLGAATASAFLVGGGTYAASAVLALTIFGAGPSDVTASKRRSIRDEVLEGLAWLWKHRLLKSLGLFVGILNLTEGMVLGILVLFVQEILGLDATAFGGLLLNAALGGLVGAYLGPRISARIGQGPTLLLTIAAMGVSPAVIAFSSSFGTVALMLGLANAGGFVWGVITVSLRQRIVPDRLLGRVNSAYRMLAWGGIPLGAILGGGLVAVGTALAGREAGLRTPFVVAAAINAVVLMLAIPRLTTARIQEARRAAGQR